MKKNISAAIAIEAELWLRENAGHKQNRYLHFEYYLQSSP